MILHKHTAVTQHGMAYLCKWPHARNKTNTSFTKQYYYFFIDICIKLHFPKYGFKCLLQTQTHCVYLCTSKKINNSMFIF